MYRILICVLLAFLAVTNVSASTIQVTDLGAISDTSVNSTQAFQHAIDSCASKGGGTVYVPAGDFMIGSIFLKSNVELHLAHGAVVYGSKSLADYKKIQPAFASLRTNEATIQLIYAENCQNVAITGYGKIDGQGRSFERKYKGDEGVGRPHLLRFITCQNIRIENLSLQNSGCWMQHYLACEDISIRGIQIFNHANYNNDGIDIDGCKNVIISEVQVDSDDDAIVLKSTSSRGCENVVVSNCIISSHTNALKLGTESNTGFKNISFANCIVKPSVVDTSKFYGFFHGVSGVSIEMVDGGVLEGVSVNHISIEGTEVPLFIRLGERNRPYQPNLPITTQGVLKDVAISHIEARGAGKIGCSITGTPDLIVENVSLSDMNLEFSGGGETEMAERDLQLAPYNKAYPRAPMFGNMPAYGFFVAKVNGLTMSRIRLRTNVRDERPALYLQEVSHAHLQGISMEVSDEKMAAIYLRKTADIHIQNCRVEGKKAAALVFSEETASEELTLTGNDLQRLIQGETKIITRSISEK